MIGEVSFLAASGLVQIPLNADEEPTAVVQRIEDIAHCFIHDLVQGRVDGCFRMIRRTSANAFEDEVSGALILGPQVTIRRFNACTATKVAQLLQVLAVMQQLLLQGRRISQREMFYMLIDSFKNQAQLNCTVLDASATLGVRRYALNVGAATRGVLAGCLELATAGSMYKVDCRYVGTVWIILRRPCIFFRPDVAQEGLTSNSVTCPVDIARLTERMANTRRRASCLFANSTLQRAIHHQ